MVNNKQLKIVSNGKTLKYESYKGYEFNFRINPSNNKVYGFIYGTNINYEANTKKEVFEKLKEILNNKNGKSYN